MPTIALNEIKLGARQRKEMGTPEFAQHISELAESIKKYGLFHPILLTEEDNTLVAGFCRMMAHAHLGIGEIEYKYKSQLTEIEQKEIELEENLRRKNLEWYEAKAAVAEIHELKKLQDPNWSIENTAAILGTSKGHVSEAIQVAKAIEVDPALRELKGSTAVIRKLQTEKKIEQRKHSIAIERLTRGSAIKAEILCGDARELIKLEKDASYDAVVTNFPFGVDLELKQDSGNNLKVYEDNEEYITDLVMEMVPQIFRVLKPDSWFVGFFDVNKITYNSHLAQLAKSVIRDVTEKTLEPPNSKILRRGMGLTWWLEKAGFSYVSPVPAVWAKPNKTQGIIGNPQKGMIVAYEAMVFASKGEAILLKQGRNNLFSFDTLPTDERMFSLQMPMGICHEILNMIVLGGGKVLDPFAGVGSFGLAALEKQCEFRGYELNEKRASDGNLLLNEFQMLKEDPDVRVSSGAV